jgi:hypothetical protein
MLWLYSDLDHRDLRLKSNLHFKYVHTPVPTHGNRISKQFQESGEKGIIPFGAFEFSS